MSTELQLNAKQKEVHNATESEIFYISGLGGGKSFELGQWVLHRASVKESIGLMAAPTYDVIKQSTLLQVQASWLKVGIIENEHYVVNSLPPPEWGVKPYSSLNNSRVITFRWQSYLLLETLDNYNKIRGAEYDYIAVDEFRDVKFSLVRPVLLGRLRGKEFKRLKKPIQLLWVSTPPDNPTELNEVIEENKSEIKLVEGTSYDNQDNLPMNYISNLQASYDPVTFAREIHGSRINSIVSNAFMTQYQSSKHESERVVFNEHKQLRIIIDFNINPFAVNFAHLWRDEQGEHCHIFDEMDIENGSIPLLIDRIKQKYSRQLPNCLITGDAMGKKRSIEQRDNASHYLLIQRGLNLRASQIVTPPNPTHENSRSDCNYVLYNFPDFKINQLTCPNTCRDMKIVQCDGFGSIIKSNRKDSAQQADHLDNVRYLVNTFLFDWIKNHSKNNRIK